MNLLPSTDTSAGQRNRTTAISQSNGKSQIMHLGKNDPWYQYPLRTNWLKDILTEDNFSVHFPMSWQCALAQKMISAILGFIRRIVARMSRAMMLSPYSALVRNI